MRADHFRFLDQHLQLLDRDLEAYLRLFVEHPYFTWYTKWCSFSSGAHRDEQRSLEAFRRRVVGAAELWRSFKAVGFDPLHLVTLRVASPGAATPTGKATGATPLPRQRRLPPPGHAHGGRPGDPAARRYRVRTPTRCAR